jgi:sensor domain CHASE-containing protein
LTLFASLLGLVLVFQLVLLVLAVVVFQRRFGTSSQVAAWKELADQAEAVRQSLSGQLASATADTAMRLEQTKGAIGLQVADRLGDGFNLGLRRSLSSWL